MFRTPFAICKFLKHVSLDYKSSSKSLLSLTFKLNVNQIYFANKRNNHSQCYNVNAKEIILETTRAKLENTFANLSRYLESLLKEKAHLDEFLVNTTTNKSSSSASDSASNLPERFKRLNYLSGLVDLEAKFRKVSSDLVELKQMQQNESDKELRAAVEQDIAGLEDELFELKIKLLDALVPDDLEDKEDVVVELSAGVGGAESRIFCGELFDMYRAFCSVMKWSFRPIEVDNEGSELDAYIRKAVIEVNGHDVYKLLKFESGVHRVQRVPKTDSKGRIHTSTVGVVVTPKPAEIKIELNPKELKIETKTSGGPGGQHANKTESAVRMIHLPTGIMVYCDQERHQNQNRATAFALLKQKLYQREHEEHLNKRQANRRMQIGSSGRSERIRTYNYLQDRITDHRLDENFKGISAFLTNGELLASMIANLKYEQRVEILSELIENFEKQNSNTQNKSKK